MADKAIVPAGQQSGPTMAILPAMSIDQAVEQFHVYQQLKERLGTAEDFQVIAGKKHPKKSFVRKVQRFFSISCELLRDEPIRDGKGEIIGWIATARAIHLPTGAYQDADGSCTFAEKRAKGQDTLHNVRAHAVTRAKNRAILDLAGFGEVSAEEIVLDEGESRSEGDRRPERDEPATDKQLKKMWGLMKQLGWSTEHAKAFIKERYGVEQSKELTKRQASDAIDYLTDTLDIEVTAQAEGEGA